MKRENNFDFLRIVFAAFVIITHSYPLSGVEECDWLCQITHGQLSFSFVGVKGFFIISGFLIYQSLERSKSLTDYFWKRFLRLFPALFVVLALTIIFGQFVYVDNGVSYFNNLSVWTYLPINLTLYKSQVGIVGIFDDNPYKSAINGSLWTIPYEFTMYILLSMLYLFRNKRQFSQLILIIAFGSLVLVNTFFIEPLSKYRFLLSVGNLIDLGVFFVAGSLLASLKIDEVKVKFVNVILLTALIVMYISISLSYFVFLKFFVLPLVVICFGLNATYWVKSIGERLGDLSYGIYIYGFPVQQALMYYLHLNHMYLMAGGLVVSCFFAYLSWHLIEAKALKMKKYTPRVIFSVVQAKCRI